MRAAVGPPGIFLSTVSPEAVKSKMHTNEAGPDKADVLDRDVWSRRQSSDCGRASVSMNPVELVCLALRGLATRTGR